MSKLTFSLKREWIDEAKKEFGNPIRKLERIVQEFADAKLSVSSYSSLTVEVPEEKRTALYERIVELLSDKFQMEEPWKVLTVSGDIEKMSLKNEYLQELSEDPKEEEKSETKTAEERQETTASASTRVEESKATSAGTQSTETGREATAGTPFDGAAAGEAPARQENNIQSLEEKVKRVVEELCATIPMKYSPELSDCIREFGQVIPMLERMRSRECFWSQNLLVSMDMGYGFSSFLKGLAKLYFTCNLVEKDDSEYTVKEILIENSQSQDNKYAGWKNALARAQEFGQQNQRRSQKVILAMDISQWQTELTSSVVVDYLRQIADASRNFTCIFRVPFMEQQVVQKIAEALSDVMTVKTVVAAPISIENMVDYIKNKLRTLECVVDDECDDELERWIIKEKSDDSFFGYKTLGKMVRQLVYHKALLNSSTGTVNQCIVPEDIAGVINEDPGEMGDPRELLNKLIGMADVKRHIQEIVIQIKTQKEMAAQGMSLERPCIHMMFTGNPGTGKTTVARILARLMKEEGVLRKGHFYEITGRNLCGRYIGETAPKTSMYCRDAYGSVLFIDEAYSLYQGNDSRDYGKEAIQTLLAEMENHRDDFCVILAGYKSEMEQLMTINPGLESRIPYVINFPNYTKDEMEQIFFAMMEGKFTYDDTLKETVHDFFESIPDSMLEDETFSNARMVRNLFERAWGKAAYRRSLSGETTLEIRKEDLQSASEEGEFKKLMEKKVTHKRIGFATN